MAAQIPGKRLLLVNRDFQFRYVRVSVAIGIISTMLTGIVILYPLYLFKILVVPQFLPAPILAAMFAAGLINIAMVVIFGVLLSHKIAGPMFSMVRHFRKMASGSLMTEMRSRPGDDLQFVVRNLNDLSVSLVQMAKKDLGLIDEAIEDSSDAIAVKKHLIHLRQQVSDRIDGKTSTMTAGDP